MNRKKVIAMGLIIMITTQMMMPATMVSAAEYTGNKEEVVYVIADANGSVDRVDVVNIFGKGDVTDYGAYSSVKMLNTTDAIKLDGDEVTFSTDKDKVYYQGTLEDAQIPWNISLTYTLDGKTVTPEELAGASGALEIHFLIEKNEGCTSDFYDDYALQAALTLDTENCKNIEADGATMANVGADKQISYTVLPGKGLDATVRADVTDFEMDAVAINGVQLNLDVDIDDEELMDQVTQITDAARDLNDGAGKLSDGTDELLDGGSSLSDGAAALYDGAGELENGITSLKNGVTSIQKASAQLNEKSKTLTDGSAAVKQGIAEAYDGSVALNNAASYTGYAATLKENGLDLEQLQAGNTQAAQLIANQIKQLNASLEQIKSTPGYDESEEAQAQAATLQSQISSLNSVSMLLKGNNAAISGTSMYFDELEKGAKQLSTGMKQLKTSYETMDSGISSYTDGVGQLTDAYAQIVTGANALAGGSKELVSGSADLKQGTRDLYDGMVTLDDGTKELNDGTQEFYEKTDGMDTKVEDTIDEMVGSLSGSDSKPQSFVSDKNTNVAAVQFVIKMAAIEKSEESVQTQAQTKTLSFWEKLMNLFHR